MSELQKALEARRRRTDALANLIPDDDDDDDDLLFLQSDKNDDDKKDDDDEMPATPPSFTKRQNHSQSKDTKNNNLRSPSSLSNDQHYRPFVERKIKPSLLPLSSSGKQPPQGKSSPVRTYSNNPPIRFSANEPSNDEEEGGGITTPPPPIMKQCRHDNDICNLKRMTTIATRS